MNTPNWVCEWIDNHSSEIWDLSLKIWQYAELSGQEQNSSRALCEALKHYGFSVQENLAGIQTAFSARYGEGEPTIGFLGEYDALESLSQKAGSCVCETTPETTSGHGCGHNLLGCGSLAAAVAVKEYMESAGIPGSVVYYGCPSEEQGCGKMHMMEGGCFRELDAALTWHPMDRNEVDGTSSLASLCMEFNFEGKSAHAAFCPEQGRSALHAVELMNIAVNFMREHVISDARIHYAIRESGGTATNVIQSKASVIYEVRAPKEEQIQEISERIIKAARGAALMTETEMNFSYGDHYMNFISNDTINRVAWENLKAVGSPDFTKDEIGLAASLYKTCHAKGETADPIDRTILPYQGLNGCLPVSTDVGNVSHIVPTIQLYTACCAKGTPNHSWQMVSQAGSSIGKKGMLTASKVLALTALELLENPEVLRSAKAEHVKTVGC